MITNWEMREFAFRFKYKGDIIMTRHYQFFDEQDLKNHVYFNPELKEVFFSVAYYRFPEAKPRTSMKQWLGADLVFDFDGDSLIQARDEAVAVVTILENTFALEEIKIVYTGNRGYHVHVQDECVRTLKPNARAEIFEYMLQGCHMLTVDRQVVVDVVRLVRVPGYKHGKTGRLAKVLTKRGLQRHRIKED